MGINRFLVDESASFGGLSYPEPLCANDDYMRPQTYFRAKSPPLRLRHIQSIGLTMGCLLISYRDTGMGNTRALVPHEARPPLIGKPVIDLPLPAHQSQHNVLT